MSITVAQTKRELQLTLRAQSPAAWPSTIQRYLTRLASSGNPHPVAIYTALLDVFLEIVDLVHSRPPSAIELPSCLLPDPSSITHTSIPELCHRFQHEVIHWVLSQDRTTLAEKAEYRALIRYITSHLHEKLTIPHLCAISHRTPRDLRQLCLRHSGKKPPELVTSLRIHHAIKLIGNGEKISAVALLVGFKNRTAFYSSFHRITGRLPGDYRPSAPPNHTPSTPVLLPPVVHD